MEKTITIIFLALLAIEFFKPQEKEEQWQETKEQILNPPTQKHYNKGKVEVLVQYCTRAFQQIQQAIFHQFDERVEVMGMPYPIGEGKEKLLQLLTIIQYGFIASLIFFDKQISEMSEFWRTNISPSKIKYGFLGYVALNFIITQLSSSGAFEIFVNDQLIHSKINTGQMPSMDTIFSIIRNKI